MIKLKKVSADDINVELLIKAAREGRLYIDCTAGAPDKDQVVKQVRAYVKRIDRLATPRFRTLIGDVWNQILAINDFVEYLEPGTKTRKCREFDKYNVMRIIGVLREKNVYEPMSDRKYSAILEPEEKESPYRRYLGMGIEQRQLLIEIRRIVAKYQL